MALFWPATTPPETASLPALPDSPDFHGRKSFDSPAWSDHSAPSPWPAHPDASPSAHRPLSSARESCSDHPVQRANPLPPPKHSPPLLPHTKPGESAPDLHPPAFLSYRTT